MTKRSAWVPLLIFVFALGVAGTASAKPIDREFHETFAVSPGAKLDLIHGDGDVTIRTWDKDVIEVSVRYHAEIRKKVLAASPTSRSISSTR